MEIRIYLSTSALKEIASMSEVFILMLGSKRILEWEMSIPRMFMDEKSKEIGELYGLLWQTGERLSDLLKKKLDYDILHPGDWFETPAGSVGFRLDFLIELIF